MTLGKKIKKLRAKHNLSQPELAEKIGIEQSYLSKLENDKSVPSNEIFNNTLKAFGLTLEQFVTDIAQGAELDRLNQIPDVQQYFSSKQTHNKDIHRRFLYISSLLIVLASTLFFIGHNKQIFSETQFQYESRGVLFDDEPADIFNRWQRLIPQEQHNALYQKRKLEMEKRVDEKSIGVFKHSGPQIRLDTQGGYRQYLPLVYLEISV